MRFDDENGPINGIVAKASVSTSARCAPSQGPGPILWLAYRFRICKQGINILPWASAEYVRR